MRFYRNTSSASDGNVYWTTDSWNPETDELIETAVDPADLRYLGNDLLDMRRVGNLLLEAKIDPYVVVAYLGELHEKLMSEPVAYEDYDEAQFESSEQVLDDLVHLFGKKIYSYLLKAGYQGLEKERTCYELFLETEPPYQVVDSTNDASLKLAYHDELTSVLVLQANAKNPAPKSILVYKCNGDYVLPEDMLRYVNASEPAPVEIQGLNADQLLAELS